MKKFQRTLLRKAMMGMKKQKGMTLLEIIIALGIIGVVSAGVVVLAQRAIDAQNMTKATQAVNTIQIAMTQTYRNLGRYPAPTGTAGEATVARALVGLGRVAEDDIKNAFTGEDLVIHAFPKFAPGDNKAFAIAYNGLTLDQCRQLVTNTIDMFPYIEIADAPTGPYQTEGALAGTGILKSPAGGVNLDLANVAHIQNLCSGGGDDAAAAGATFTVLLGNS